MAWMIRPPRRLSDDEIEALLALDVPARFATLDADGFPHVTPLWFVWHDGAFHLTSYSDRPHLRRLADNPRAGLCVDIEQSAREDGERPNLQVRATGTAELLPDEEGAWTQRIDEKYVRARAGAPHASARTAHPRVLIRLRAGPAARGGERLTAPPRVQETAATNRYLV
jgi:nitroimidazol reductase NimA-like FMN-containing flavoprotein (pyridoxamine 5'-phosphate oxidase superfamily)